MLEDAWKELLDIYKKGYDFLSEEDIRCLFYHLCAKRSREINYVHAQKPIEERTQRKYDVAVNDSLNKSGIAIELKCWLWKSSGISNRGDVTKEQIKRLEDAAKSKKYDLAYLFVLDELSQDMVKHELLKEVQTYSRAYRYSSSKNRSSESRLSPESPMSSSR